MDKSLPSKRDLENALETVMDYVISTDSNKIQAYVDKLKEQNPGISRDKLAKKVLHRKSLKNGLVGGATSLGGILTMPVTIPTDLIASWRIQATMAFSIAYIYGHTENTTDLKTDLYLILAGDSAKEALKRLGIEISKDITKKAVNKYISNNYDRINLTVPKGKKTDISKHAEIHGESLNGFINRAITQTIESDNTSQEGA